MNLKKYAEKCQEYHAAKEKVYLKAASGDYLKAASGEDFHKYWDLSEELQRMEMLMTGIKGESK